MANNSPTLVMASLSDDQLKKSIDSLVTHVDEAMKKMVQSTNNAVGEMEAKLKSLGSLKIDTGGSNDGGTGRRTQQHEKLTKAVNDASEAVSKETQKLQDLQQSLSGASDREQNFISQKERAASTIAQENELLSKQQSELSALKVQQQSLADAHQKDMQSSQQLQSQYDNTLQKLKTLSDGLRQAKERYREFSEAQTRLSSDANALRIVQGKNYTELGERRLFEALNQYYKEVGWGRKQLDADLKDGMQTFSDPRLIEILAQKIKGTEEDARKLVLTLQENTDKLKLFKQIWGEFQGGLSNIVINPNQQGISVFKNNAEALKSSQKADTEWQERLNQTVAEYRVNETNLASAKKELSTLEKQEAETKRELVSIEQQQVQATNKSNQIRQESLNLDAKIQEKEKEISETRGRIAAATKEQSEADKNASQAAKEKANIQSQVANQEKQVAEAKKQLTTATQQHTDAETKSSRATKEKTMTLDQQASAINTVVQSEKKYTDEVLRQAAAIRSSKEWQEKGHVVIGDVNYYDKERANVSKRDKQLLLSLEEQIVQAQQKEAQEALVAAEAKRQQAQAAKEAAQASKGVSAYDLGIDPNISAGRQRQIASTRAASKETEYLKQQVASLLEVEEREIKTANTTSSSYAQLAQYLKNLQSAYQRLGADRIAKGEGTDLANEIQRTQRAMQKLQQTMSRPISLKDAMGLSEKTLDDIAYKMRQLASYRSGLNVDTQKKEILQVNDEYNRLKKRMDEVMQKNQQMIASNTALGRSWNYMKNRLAFYFTVGAGTQFIKQLVDIRSQYEMNERALGILINSAERGTQIFNELSQMALVSPYTLIELSAAAKQLTAYDIAAKDVVNTTRRLADMAAAVGIPIERLTYALGQVKAYGYLNARDARMFANAGIPLVKNLSEYYTELEGRLVSTADIYDRIKKKQIGYEEVMSTISKMTDEGGKFYDFQAKMAETLKVQLANLTLAWNNMLNAMGEESQGVLVAGISTLKQLFLHWKDIEHVLYELVVALGAYKAYQIIATRLMGATAASLDAQVLAIKRNNAAMLEKQALTRKLTTDELRQVAAQKQVTAADYQNALSGKQLTKQKALLLVALNKNNVQLKAALVNMGLLTTAEAASITRGKALAIVFKSIGISIKNAALAIKAFAASMWPLLVVGALYELWHAWDSYGEHIEEVNKQAAEHAKEAFENIKQYLESDVTSALQDRLAKGGKVESDAVGQKTWDEMREKIELSSSASNAFIAKLMQINDINERLSAGFGYLEDIQRVDGVMKTLEEDAVTISSTTLGGLFGEGLKDDLEDYINAYQKYLSLNENLRQGTVGEEYFYKQKRALEEFRGEVEKTTTSLYNIASKEGFNTNEQREFFEREISEIAQAEQMGAKESRIFRMQAEKEYYEYAKKQLEARYKYEEKMGLWLRLRETRKRIKDLDNEFGANKAMQESFFTWLTEKQDHAVKNMLRGKTQEEIKQGEWLKGSNAKWVEEMARKFSKEYGVSFDDLHQLVLNANTWSINIPVFFQTIGQPLSDVQRDYEARTGKKFSSNPLIKDAKTQVEIIDILKKKQKEVANEMATAEKAGGKYWENNKKRYEEENNALIADIHAYNALTDAEEKANKKGGSKKDPMLDTLKQTIEIVKKLQSEYDTLTKSGASSAIALEDVRSRYSRTINLLNKDLAKFGLPQLNLDMIKGRNPNDVLEYFQKISDILTNKGLSTLERQKAVEAVIQEFSLKAETYNLDMITKGLNNELGKLKDEYELAVELDANPEMGNLFADWMGFDMSNLPHTAEEYAKRMTKALNKYLAEEKSGIEIGDLLALTDDDLRMFQQRVDNGELTQVWVDNIVKNTKEARNALKKENGDIAKEWDKLVQKYSEYEYKIAQIQRNANKERKDFALKYGTNDQKERALTLTTEIDAEEDPQKRAELIQELKNLVATIAGDDKAKLKIKAAIDKKEIEETAKTIFENFKKSDDYERFFNSINTLTMDSALKIKGEIRKGIVAAFKDGALSVSQFKKEIKALEDQFDKLTQNNQNWFVYMKDGFNGLIQKAKETGNEIEAIGAKISKEGKVDKKDQDYLDSFGKVFTGQNGYATNFSDMMWQFGADFEGLGKQTAAAGQNMQGAASDFQGAVTIVDMIIKNIHQTVQAIGSVIDELDSMRSEDNKISNSYWQNFQKYDNYASSGWENLKSGNIGGATGDTVNSFIVLYRQISKFDRKQEKTNKSIKESQREVKNLELAYKDLQDAINNSYGAEKWAAQQMAQTNKELQLAELKRQLQLEESRDSKIRDIDKIQELKGQIKDLELEIKNASNEIASDLLGISSVGDAAENLVLSMINAFRQGEKYMEEFDNSFDNMINNMIAKTFASLIIGDKLKELWDSIKQKAEERGKGEKENVMSLEKQLEAARNRKVTKEGAVAKDGEYSSEEEKQADLRRLEKQLEAARKVYADAIKPTPDDIKDATQQMEGLRDYVQNTFLSVMDGLGITAGDQKKSNLSALQQGIQGVTEDTAGAVEAYLNGMSQQAYLRNDLLTQIRDAIVGMDIDVQTATMGEILLQLRSSYEVQMAIHGILEGVLTPSGRAFSVELAS